MRAAAACLPRAPVTAADLITSFESLGDNCEFGTIQRLCGAEPQGLFRFSASTIDHIIDVIETEASHLYTDEDLELFLYDGHDEYMVKSRHYDDFVFHTQVSPSAVDRRSFAGKTGRRLEYLKGKLQEDLRLAEKVFVRKGQENADKITRLHDALRRFGPNSLLWVVEAAPAHPAGTVEIVGDGLFRGYVSKFKDFGTSEPADLASWVKICQLAHRRHALDRRARSEGLSRPKIRYEENRIVSTGNAWMFGPACDVNVCVDPSLGQPPGTVRSVTLQRHCNHDETLALVDINRRIRPQTMIVFSVGVWVAAGAPPACIDACFLNFPGLHNHPFDLSTPDRWQRIWVSAQVPRGVSNAVVAVRAGGGEGSRIRLASWRLEEGVVPSEPRSPPRGLSFALQAARRAPVELWTARPRS